LDSPKLKLTILNYSQKGGITDAGDDIALRITVRTFLNPETLSLLTVPCSLFPVPCSLFPCA
jgi:hypothetical protein